MDVIMGCKSSFRESQTSKYHNDLPIFHVAAKISSSTEATSMRQEQRNLSTCPSMAEKVGDTVIYVA